MIYNLALNFASEYSFLNIFKYITFRAGASFATSMIICFIIGPTLINMLRKKQKKGQPIRKDGPQWQIAAKKGTPTMGGTMILFSLIVSTLLWTDIFNIFIWLLLFITLGFGLIGFLDDYLKINRFSHKGLSGKMKLFFQVLFSFTFSFLLFYFTNQDYSYLTIPVFKNLLINVGYFWFIFSMLVIVGSSNAVNLTDGLDGLAIVPIVIVTATLAIISYIVGNSIFSEYLNLSYIKGMGEISIFCSSLVGAGLGFLWFNAPPAKIFMGDTGSLAAGAAIGAISVMTRNEFVLAIAGGLFVLEAISVIVQVISFKLTGKRIFKMAPIHHHFEQKGWSESTIVIRFWIISIILAMTSLLTLKVR
ncbi:MAG: Phospho-N-acetylmuramoyl-pentapeptide-transferase [Alphaproteobacteria bacterium MarineAlpha9_Bin4]|nr:phospho-N-acetylmuramoyl-pentapeptide-transferase [Pelagibacterales bacterium]PPR27668.1 MAG: Phospho-N-acetylmuramoyl-pentapeptide-transferase [Alphaproteobacteria bacterium MarineAlpha9_Bin4]|tara:strand:+ start:51 stop:1136 length:1086 start_codon:yes stop_codon:yes gene_type:complete